MRLLLDILPPLQKKSRSFDDELNTGDVRYDYNQNNN